jgi:hypothetical protein
MGAGMNRTPEYSETCSRKGRGRAKRSLDLIAAMCAAAAAAHPITGRGIGYKLFTAGLIPSMARAEMQRVYRLLKEARERGHIPWEWIVDETRALEKAGERPELEETGKQHPHDLPLTMAARKGVIDLIDIVNAQNPDFPKWMCLRTVADLLTEQVHHLLREECEATDRQITEPDEQIPF